MRSRLLLLTTALVAGCTNVIAERRAELATWVGKPETELLGAMGAPARTYTSGTTKYLTYEDPRVDIRGSPYYFGPGPAYYGSGFPSTVTTRVCDTTFTVAKGVVRAFNIRGSGCS